MKVSAFFLVIFFMFPVFLFSQESVQNNAFKAGEKLTYKLTYNNAFGEVYAGNATVEVREDTVGGKPGFQIVGIGETNTFFDFFYGPRKIQAKLFLKNQLPLICSVS